MFIKLLIILFFILAIPTVVGFIDYMYILGVIPEVLKAPLSWVGGAIAGYITGSAWEATV